MQTNKGIAKRGKIFYNKEIFIMTLELLLTYLLKITIFSYAIILVLETIKNDKFYRTPRIIIVSIATVIEAGLSIIHYFSGTSYFNNLFVALVGLLVLILAAFTTKKRK